MAAAVSTAKRAADALNRDPPRVASLEVLARRLLRAESVASSRIEGLVLSQRLARAEVEEPDARDEIARSILVNVTAMEYAVALGAGAKPLRLKNVLDIHRHLATTTPEIAGKLRDRQNWIGGNHVVLRRRGLAPRHVPPVSLVLAADAKAYVGGLTAFREDRLAEWVLLSAQAIERAAAKASELALRLAELQEKW